MSAYQWPLVAETAERARPESVAALLCDKVDRLSPAPCRGPGKSFFVRDRSVSANGPAQRRPIIKLIDPDEADPMEVKLFSAMASAGASLDHRAIARVYGADEITGVRYCMSEYPAEYDTLRGLISRTGWLDAQQRLAYSILGQIFDAIAHAHEKGILHLSLNSEAILLEPNGNVILTGFGLSVEDAQGLLPAELTRYSEVDYLSPEQVHNGLPSERSDLFSLGILMYEMFTDRIPSMKADGSRKWGGYSALPPKMIVDTIPDAVSDAILKLLAEEPVDRCITLLELRAMTSTLMQTVTEGGADDRDNAAGAPVGNQAPRPHEDRHWQAEVIALKDAGPIDSGLDGTEILELDDLVAGLPGPSSMVAAEKGRLLDVRATYEPPTITRIETTSWTDLSGKDDSLVAGEISTAWAISGDSLSGIEWHPTAPELKPISGRSNIRWVMLFVGVALILGVYLGLASLSKTKDTVKPAEDSPAATESRPAEATDHPQPQTLAPQPAQKVVNQGEPLLAKKGPSLASKKLVYGAQPAVIGADGHGEAWRSNRQATQSWRSNRGYHSRRYTWENSPLVPPRPHVGPHIW
jgi:serine/threonine protein kinase